MAYYYVRTLDQIKHFDLKEGDTVVVEEQAPRYIPKESRASLKGVKMITKAGTDIVNIDNAHNHKFIDQGEEYIEKRNQIISSEYLES